MGCQQWIASDLQNSNSWWFGGLVVFQNLRVFFSLSLSLSLGALQSLTLHAHTHTHHQISMSSQVSIWDCLKMLKMRDTLNLKIQMILMDNIWFCLKIPKTKWIIIMFSTFK